MADSLTHQALYRTMEQLVNSAEGIKLAVRASNEGYPAIAGVDALLRRELGSEYELAGNGVWWASLAVSRLMRDLGFVEAGTGRCPPGCVATKGVRWKPLGKPKVPLSVERETILSWR